MVNINPRQLRLVLPALMITAGALVGCDSPAQPVNPTNSTIPEPRIDEVPEGNIVPPANVEEEPISTDG